MDQPAPTGATGPGPAAPADLAAFLQQFREHMADLHERAQPLRHLIDATSIPVVSAGGEVVLTVTLVGELVGIEFLPAADRAEPAALAAAIIETYQRASTPGTP